MTSHRKRVPKKRAATGTGGPANLREWCAPAEFRDGLFYAEDLLLVGTDEHGIIRLMNGAAEHALGFPAVAVIGRETPLIFEPRDLLCYSKDGSAEMFFTIDSSNQARVLPMLREGIDHVFCSLTRSDSTVFPAQIWILPCHDRRGNRIGFLGLGKDVSGLEKTKNLVREKQEMHLLGMLRLSQMSDSPVGRLVHFSIVEGMRLTRCRLGFIQFLNGDDDSVLFVTAPAGHVILSDRAGTAAFFAAMAPVLTEVSEKQNVLRLEDSSGFPAFRTALPPQFADVTTGLCLPIFAGNGISCIAGVGNHENPLEEADIRKFTLLMENMLRVVYLKRAETERERLRIDLAKAREQEMLTGSQIQQTLLMGSPPRGIHNAQISAITVPSLGVDGDFYDFFVINNVCFDVLVGDVMGKGVPAALIGAAAKSHFQRALSRLLIYFPRNQFPTLEDILAKVHSEMTPQLSSLNSFLCLHFARFDTRRRTLDLINCGHTTVIHYRPATGTVAMLPSTNAPLGINDNEKYHQSSFAFLPGDIFLFYSDGVSEIRNAAGVFFGTEPLVTLIKAHHAHAPQELIRKVQAAVTSFAGTTAFADDLTLVVIKIGP